MAEVLQHHVNRDPFRSTKFLMVERLGSGGMGEVYVVEHRELGKRFVAKILHKRYGSDPQLIDRMRVEAEALGCLNHPNIVSVTGFETTLEGRPFIVMECLRGRTLADEVVARRSLPVAEALDYARQALSALGAAHALGIVHRDMKPENLFLHDPPGAPRIVKVLDFGVARVLPGTSPDAPRPLANPTETGVVIGTPRFVSPEGAIGWRVDERADIYSMGLILYEMLAGRGPFDHVESDELVLAAHASDEPEPPSRFAERPIPAALDRAVLRALSKDRGRRFANAAEFDQELVAIRALLDEAPAAPLAPPAKLAPVAPASAAAAPARALRPQARVLVFVLLTVLAAAFSAGAARWLERGTP